MRDHPQRERDLRLSATEASNMNKFAVEYSFGIAVCAARGADCAEIASRSSFREDGYDRAMERPLDGLRLGNDDIG